MKAYAIGLTLLVAIALMICTIKSVDQEHAEARLQLQANALNESYEIDISELCSLNQESTAHDCKIVGL